MRDQKTDRHISIRAYNTYLPASELFHLLSLFCYSAPLVNLKTAHTQGTIVKFPMTIQTLSMDLWIR